MDFPLASVSVVQTNEPWTPVWMAAEGTTSAFEPVFKNQVDIHELVGKQIGIVIGEYRLQLVGAGGGVNLVVGGEQLARG